MGILNVTPDSFYDGGINYSADKALLRIEEMISQGADIIDVGGESTRPGAEPVTEDEEIKRVIPVITQAAKRFKNIIISVDTYKASVARTAIKAGAKIVNDISAMNFDPQMAEVIASENAHVILMHIKGTPKDMQKNPVYKNTVKQIYSYLKNRTDYARKNGIKENKILLDPGIGFGKKAKHNIDVLSNISSFVSLNKPLVLGISRKSFIGKLLGSEKNPIPANQRLSGTLACTAWAYLSGVKIFRTHDVLETRQFLDMLNLISNRK